MMNNQFDGEYGMDCAVIDTILSKCKIQSTCMVKELNSDEAISIASDSIRCFAQMALRDKTIEIFWGAMTNGSREWGIIVLINLNAQLVDVYLVEICDLQMIAANIWEVLDDSQAYKSK